jgi:DNA-binding response OmpR family regulator
LRIAILEDDEHLALLMQQWLEAVGHECQIFHAGSPFKRVVAIESFDLLILDWILPDTSGDEVLLWVREHIDWHIPVMFITVLDSEENIVKGLTLGADDYMVKPVKQLEMLARVAALGRRINVIAEPRQISYDPYQFDMTKRVVSNNGSPISLTNKEFDLAAFLFKYQGRIISRGHILESVWGSSQELNTRTVDTHISRIRNKLGLHPEESEWRLSSIYMHGYRLENLREIEEKYGT